VHALNIGLFAIANVSACSIYTFLYYALISSGVNMGQGQSGQVIKPFQITPYVNDFQTLNNPGS